MDLIVRPFQPDDADELAQLFYASVREGTAAHYDQTEREAWAPDVLSGDDWRTRLADMWVLLAAEDSGIAGFMTLEADGHIDFAFVRHDLIGKGVANVLYEHIESKAQALHIERLYTEASHLARSFFAKQGWSLIATQQVEANGVYLTNHRMEKFLAPAPN